MSTTIECTVASSGPARFAGPLGKQLLGLAAALDRR
jgi:hypothetical protein